MKAHPLPNCLSLTSMVGFYEHFLFSPHASIARILICQSLQLRLAALWFRYISITPLYVEVHPLEFFPRVFKFFSFFQLFYPQGENLQIIKLILIVLKYSRWINVQKARPLPDFLTFTSMGGFYGHFCSLHMLLLPEAKHADVTVTASGIKVSLNFCNSLFWLSFTLWDSFPEYLNFSSFSRCFIHE